MKLIRHITGQGPAYAALGAGGKCHPLLGSIYGDFEISEETIAQGTLLAPVEATNIFGIGLNYRKHANELGRTPQAYPLVFIKSTNAVQSPGGPIEIPATLRSDEVDYEGELAVVIGREAKNVREEEALDYVLGYTVANDVSARDWQFKLGGGQFCQSKSFDTFCPLGPVLVTRDELADPGRLRLRTYVNGDLRQDASTAELLFSVPSLISFLSASKTLMPGTVILTGSPGGVGHGHVPPRYLRPGDVVTVEIEGVGKLSNRVVLEQKGTSLTPVGGMGRADLGA